MKKRIFFSLSYFGILTISNFLFYTISLMGNIGWKPYPSVFELILFPFLFIGFGLLMLSFFRKKQPYVITSVAWLVLTTCTLVANYMNGYELIALTNRNISYWSSIVEFLFKNSLGITGKFTEIFTNVILIFLYHYLTGMFSFSITEKYLEK